MVIRAEGGGNGLAASYAYQYLAGHAAACEDVQALEQLVVGFGFLANVFKAGHGSALVRDVASMGVKGASALVKDAQRWLLAQQAALNGLGAGASAKAVAWTVVQSCPQGSPVLSAARQEFYVRSALASGQQPWDCRLVLGGKQRWGAIWSVLQVWACVQKA